MNKKTYRFLLTLMIGALVCISAATGYFAMSVLAMDGVPAVQHHLTTRFFDRNGDLYATRFIENRFEVPIEDIPDELIWATLSVEDRNFYDHFGFDLHGIIRAAYHNLMEGKVVQGGSTITQQLAKNLFLTHDRTWHRKAKEAAMAVHLERTLTKEEILEKYLNAIYYGHSAYGIEAASQTYFDKSSSELNLAEAALLAGLPRGPRYYSPFIDANAAVNRQAVVLQLMEQEGYITPEQKKDALKTPLSFAQKTPSNEIDYFIDYVLTRELAFLWDKEPELLSRGGLDIYTTLDPHMQASAERILKERLTVRYTDSEGIQQPQGALLAIDPETGHIKAMVGGRDFRETNLNRVFSHRSPGSAFKPFVYAAALEQGFTPASRFFCEPVSLFEAGLDHAYRPADFDGGYHDRFLTIREALVKSCNITAIKTNIEVGRGASVEMAKRLGFESYIGPYYSLPLGTSVVTLMEMTSAFAAFANGGNRIEPFAVTEVIDSRGKTILQRSPVVIPVLDKRVAYLLTDMMREVVQPGGTGHIASVPLDRPAAGKTGTSQEFRNAYMVGYTPELVAGVYIGDDHEKSLDTTGGRLAAPIWAEFITAALKDMPPREFHRPPGLVTMTLCPETGVKQSPLCSATGFTEIFIEGTEPVDTCNSSNCPHCQSIPWWWQRLPWWR